MGFTLKKAYLKKPEPEDDRLKHVLIHLPIEVHKKIKNFCTEKDISLQRFCCEAVHTAFQKVMR